MIFGRDKRLLLGVIALVAPVPLPFNEVLFGHVLAGYMVAVALFLHRAARDPANWLPGWAMNLLGLAYLPVLFIDLVALSGGQLVRPVIHLALFAVVVKLFALRHERDKWHVMAGVFFLFLASMGTSVHPSIVAYLVVMVVLFLWLLVRFSFFSVLARFGRGRADLAQVPLRAFVAIATLGVVVIAIPLFAALPRVRAPFLTGPGVGTGTVIHASGFSDEVTLDDIGTIRESRQLVMRLRYSPQRPQHEPRLKAATYELYRDYRWLRSPTSEGEWWTPRAAGSTFVLGRGTAQQSLEAWLEPLGSDALPVPVEALSVEVQGARLHADRGGALALRDAPKGRLRYQVNLGREQVQGPAAFPEEAEGEPSLDLHGLTPRMEILAQRLLGQGTDRERAQKLETYLSTQLSYTTDLLGRRGVDPLENFLFETRRGHCELFASAMVILLRSQGIPARLVTGFLGAEPNPFEGYYAVRRSNAHAWVEAFLREEGQWATFDPTPAAGLPGSEIAGLGMLARQMYDFLTFRWDRWVLTFGLQDQMDLFQRLRQGWATLVGLLQIPERIADGSTVVDAAPGVEGSAAAQGFDLRRWAQGSVVFFALILCLAVALLWRSRRSISATEGYRRLRDLLERSGLSVPPSLPPLALERSAVQRHPPLAPVLQPLVSFYLRESFAGVKLAGEERQEVRQRLGEVERLLRNGGSRRR